MFNVKRTLSLLAFALVVFTLMCVFTYNPETGRIVPFGNSAPAPQKLITKDELTPEQEVIATYRYGKYVRNVYNIPSWQYAIMEDLKIPDRTKLYLRTVQTQECGVKDGVCLGIGQSGRPADCGFFQINQIHGEPFRWCLRTVKRMKEASSVRDWVKFVALRNELYKSQAFWTWQRMKDQVKRFKLSEDRTLRIEKLCILHNGHPVHKYNYGNRCKIAYKKLYEFYISQ